MQQHKCNTSTAHLRHQGVRIKTLMRNKHSYVFNYVISLFSLISWN